MAGERIERAARTLRPHLEEQVREAIRRRAEMTPLQKARELWFQRVSWAYGNLALNNDRITYQMVYDAAVRDYGPPPGEDTRDGA